MSGMKNGSPTGAARFSEFACAARRRYNLFQIMSNRYKVTLESSVSFHSLVGAKARHGLPGFIKPFLNLMSGADFFKKTGKWNRREKIEDSERDQYFEHITDGETGETLHHCEEPLSKHRGHGSAKCDSKDRGQE